MLLRLATLGALGYAGYKYYESQQKPRSGVAYAKGQTGHIRDAGAAATRSQDKMSRTDERLDESFPASDATAKY